MPEPLASTSHTTVVVQEAPSNGLGTAGFVLSLVGWFTCGLLCPLGTILSFAAMFKRPWDIAIAGFTIGLVGSAFLVLFGLAFLMALAATDEPAVSIWADARTLGTFPSNQQTSLWRRFRPRQVVPPSSSSSHAGT